MTREADIDNPKLTLETLGDGRPVVLVPGGNGGLDAFESQKSFADHGYQLFAPAPRTELPAQVDFEVDADVLDQVLPHEAIHIVGHSYGGLTAMFLAAGRSSRVESLTLIEPAAMSIARNVPSVTKHVDAVERVFARSGDLGDEEFITAFTTAIGVRPKSHEALSEAERFRVRLLRRQRLPWTAQLPLEALRRGSYPKLIVTSGTGEMYEAIADRLASAIGAQRRVVPGSSHRVQDDPAFNNLLREQLALADQRDQASR